MPIHGDAAPARPTYLHHIEIPGGATSSLYAAWHDGFAQWVAQKVVRRQGRPDSLAFAEARLLKAIDHPCVVKVMDVQPEPNADAVTIIMPFYRAGSVEYQLTRRRFPLLSGITIACDMLSGLAHLHNDHGHIHRDVKTGNVLLTDDLSQGLLSDLGMAAAMDAAGTVASLPGTVAYAAPEAIARDGRIDVRADVYGAGLVAFELLAGAVMWEEVHPTVMVKRLAAGQRSVPPRLLTWQPHVPRRLRRVVERAMSPRAADRYADALAFRTALRHLKLIDWVPVTPADGEIHRWEGAWPPATRVERQRRYRVVVRSTRDGRWGATATQQVEREGRWRRFGMPEPTGDAGDFNAASQVFSAVEASALHLAPAS